MKKNTGIFGVSKPYSILGALISILCPLLLSLFFQIYDIVSDFQSDDTGFVKRRKIVIIIKVIMAVVVFMVVVAIVNFITW